MKLKFIFLLFFLACCSGIRADHLSLNGKWLFVTDTYNAGIEQQWYMPGHDTSGWAAMEVPGNWNTRMEYSGYTGAAWYRTDFAVQPENGKRLFLCFESVYFDADVWLNGEKLGSHGFGFSGFRFDITDRITAGQRNTLVVRVDNSYKIGATWNWGGIRRPVTVESLPEKRIDRIFVTACPDLKKGSADLGIRLRLAGQPSGHVRIEILDPDGETVAVVRRKLDESAGEVTVPVQIRKAQLWNFDTPLLYTVKATLEDGKENREVSERFGIRQIETDGYKLLVNGVETRLNGANWVPDDRFTGNMLPEDIYKRDIDLMKACGVNMARLSHHALPKDVLDYIDEKGILIIEEIPLWNKNKYVTADSRVPLEWLSEVIEERYNHPCIIGWSAGNEIGRLSDNPGLEGYLSSSLGQIKNLDPTRLAVYVTHTLLVQPWEPVMLSDVILYNQYGAHGERAERVNKQYPGKPIFYSEYGRQANSGDPDNRMTDYAAMMDDMSGREYLIGASVWTFNDYRTNYRDKSTDAMGNRPWGAVDVYRRKKRGFAELQRINSPLKTFGMSAEVKDGKMELSFTLQPRDLLDIPSFDLDGYSLSVEYSDANGRILASDEIRLPSMKRGSAEQKFSRNKNDAQAVHSVKARLVSPTGYGVEERRRFFDLPQSPAVRHSDCADKSIRIYFDRHPSASEWYAEYSDGQTIRRSEQTINDYITLENLSYGKSYDVTLIAVNGAGEKRAEEAMTLTTRAAELPPAIHHLALRGEYMEVGYEASDEDMCYEFLYSLSPGFENPRLVLSTVFGAVNLPVIEPGRKHYVKIRKRLRYGYESPWSMVYTVENQTI